jgi:hypothetical protein
MVGARRRRSPSIGDCPMTRGISLITGATGNGSGVDVCCPQDERMKERMTTRENIFFMVYLL